MFDISNVSVNGKNFKVRFAYPDKRNDSMRNKRRRTSTCTIVYNNNFENPFTGVSKCHSNDKFNKESGRRLAYNRAVRSLYDARIINSDEIAYLIDCYIEHYSTEKFPTA